MGLFGSRKNKRQGSGESQADNSTGMTEFERDIKELLGRDDIECRQDICEAEYAKAQRLLQNPTQESVHRAYDLMGNLASQFDYIPAILWMGDFAESAMNNYSQAAFWYKKAADLGDGNGARNYADMVITGRGVQQNQQEAMRYYSLAAERGIPEAAFVLGEFLRNKGDRENALKAYRKALDGGYQPAQIRINQISGGPQ